MPAIETHHLTRHYGTLVAVDHLDLSVEPGEIYAFLGPNGAGKTTTIRMLTGLIRPTEGTALIDGLDVTRNPLEAKARVGVVPRRWCTSRPSCSSTSPPPAWTSTPPAPCARRSSTCTAAA